MQKRITQVAITFAALITFLFVAAQMVWDFRVWECSCTNSECESCVPEFTWDDYHADAFAEYEDEFTRLFNSIETKRTKDGRLMIRPEGAKSFRFGVRDFGFYSVGAKRDGRTLVFNSIREARAFAGKGNYAANLITNQLVKL